MGKTLHIQFVTTLESESIRVLQTAYDIIQGNYHPTRQPILPYLQEGTEIIFFPELKYARIPLFWKLCATHDLKTLLENKIIIKKLKLLVEPLLEDISEEIEHKLSIWESQKKKVIKFLNEMMPQAISGYEKLEIRITAFGSTYSFMLNENKLIVYIRIDQNSEALVYSLIKGIIETSQEFEKYSDVEKNALKAFLIELAYKTKVITKKKEAIKITDPELVKKSEKYLEKLKVSKKQKLRIENQIIFLNKKNVSEKINTMQHIVLKLLIEKQNKLVGYDELTSILWQAEAESSIEALNRQITRLQKKLTEYGAKSNILLNIKGRGFTLKN